MFDETLADQHSQPKQRENSSVRLQKPSKWVRILHHFGVFQFKNKYISHHNNIERKTEDDVLALQVRYRMEVNLFEKII